MQTIQKSIKRHVAAVVRKNAGNLTAARQELVAEGYDFSVPTIAKYARSYNAPVRRRGRPAGSTGSYVITDKKTKRHVAAVVRRHQGNVTAAQTALDAEGMILSKPTIAKYARMYGVNVRRPGRHAVK